jgi:hypothetical protein
MTMAEILHVNTKWPLLILLLAACGASIWWMQSERPEDGPGYSEDDEPEDAHPGAPESPDLVGDPETPIERARREEREAVERAKRGITLRRKALTSGTAQQRLGALTEVAALRGGAVLYVEDVVECLWHEDPAVRKLAADVLLVMGEAAIQPTIESVADRVAEITTTGSGMQIPGYQEAGMMLMRAGRPAFAPVARAMTRPGMVWLANLTFGVGSEEAFADIVPILRGHLSADNEEAKYWSIVHLRKAGRDAADALPDLADMLRSDVQRLRQVTIKTLGELGPIAESVLQDLERHRDESSTSGNERKATIEAIARIRGE